MVARAIPIVVKAGMARPRMLEEMLGISYEEALFVIHTLRLRGVIDEHNSVRMEPPPLSRQLLQPRPQARP